MSETGELVTVPELAVILAVPTATAVATPSVERVAVAVLEETQATPVVRVWLLLSLGWFLCLLWHLLLIQGAGRAVARALLPRRGLSGGSLRSARPSGAARKAGGPAGEAKPGQVVLSVAALFQRSQD